MLLTIIKIVAIAILALYVVGVVAPLLALPAAIWALVKLLIIVWAAYTIIQAF